MPLNIDFLQILLHLLNFVILAGGLSFLVYRPVRKFLEERAAHFEEMEKQAHTRAEETEALHAEYEQKLHDAEVEIEQKKKQSEKEISELATQSLKEAQDKADNILRQAEQEAEDRKEHILESAQVEISELVLSAAEKLLSDTVSPERDSALYDEFIRMNKQNNTTAEKREEA